MEQLGFSLEVDNRSRQRAFHWPLLDFPFGFSSFYRSSLGQMEPDGLLSEMLLQSCPHNKPMEAVWVQSESEKGMREEIYAQHSDYTFAFSHLADAFIQSDVQGREQSSYEQ